MGDINPPSPARASSPTPAAEGMVLSSPQATEEVIITGASLKTLESSTTLAKLATKDEPVASEKGKAKLELPNLEELSTSDLHEAYLTRLSTSRELEASMVNALKRKYEVMKNIPSFRIVIYIYV